MMAGMRAAVFHGERRIGVVDTARPDGSSGAVMLHVCRTALCGSDGKLWIKGAQWSPATKSSASWSSLDIRSTASASWSIFPSGFARFMGGELVKPQMVC
jgi:hypothetical protein